MTISVQFDLTIVRIMTDFSLLSMNVFYTGNPYKSNKTRCDGLTPDAYQVDLSLPFSAGQERQNTI